MPEGSGRCGEGGGDEARATLRALPAHAHTSSSSFSFWICRVSFAAAAAMAAARRPSVTVLSVGCAAVPGRDPEPGVAARGPSWPACCAEGVSLLTAARVAL